MSDTATLEDLLAEREITRRLHDYCRGVDRGDMDLARSAFHEDAYDDHGVYQGPIDGLFEAARKGTPPFDTLKRTMHSVSNIMIDRRGDVAVVESHLQAYHEWQTEDGRQDELCGGRYVDRFERRDGAWRIADRRCVFEWSRLEDSTLRFHERLPGTFTLGTRTPDDYLWQLKASAL